MSQNINLSVSGINTNQNDYNGGPPGGMNVCDNMEIRAKNLGGPRRGFNALLFSQIGTAKIIRLTNFPVLGVDVPVALTDAGNWYYWVGGSSPWSIIPGSYSHGISPPNSLLGRSRFLIADQNLYLTTNDGVRSLSSGTSATSLRAGVPKGLNLQGAVNGDLTGFLNQNVVLTTVGTITSGSPSISDISVTSGIVVGQYVAGLEVPATLVIQDLTYTSVLFGTGGNAITVAYTTGGTAGSEVVTVTGEAISVQIQTGVSTATQVKTAVTGSMAASALVTVAVSGTGSNAQTAPVAATPLAGGLANSIPVGTTVASISTSAPLIIQTGNLTAGSTTISALSSNAGIVAGVLVSGIGLQANTRVVSISGSGPYSIVVSIAPYITASGENLTFSSDVIVTMSGDASINVTASPLIFYTGSQVAYRVVFGRVETDLEDGTITRLGSPTSQAVVTNVTAYSTDVVVTATLPKNSVGEITFVQLYRSAQTASASISPLDQYNLVYERLLTPSDFTNRVITLVDSVPDSLRGISLYSGSDQEGALQANDPPPLAWDIAIFRDFMLYGNVTYPSSANFTVIAVGSPNGIQNGDTITINGTFAGSTFSETYTGASSENQASREFLVASSGTPSQNITDTVNSLIRVINYDNALPVHAILLSTPSDLPGQMFLEMDNPSLDTFTVNSTRPLAFDPDLTNLESTVNTESNGVGVSKAGELEAVPATSLVFAGDSSAAVLRMIPLRDYVVVLKEDGIYKGQGVSPSTFTITPFDLTTQIIGPDTAVSLNAGVWMLSTQGIVSISDGGVDAKSIPLDNQLNALIGGNLAALSQVSFGIGYESDRKYILAVPSEDLTYCDIEYNFNYVTTAFTTWSRNFYYGYINKVEDRLYVSRADPTNFSVSMERDTQTYQDYVDEAVSVTIVGISGTLITLSSANGIKAGDILYSSDSLNSPITSVNLITNQITVLWGLAFIPGTISVLSSFLCSMTWKQISGDNPAFLRMFQEGQCLFKNARFSQGTLNFQTNFSQRNSPVPIYGKGYSRWGMFPWGKLPWGGVGQVPGTCRFIVPGSKQLAAWIIVGLQIQQGWSDFLFQGMSMGYENQSEEVGRT